MTAAPSPPAGSTAEGLCVVVVEDHAFQRSMLVQMLGAAGAAEVHEAVDGRAAIDLLASLLRRPDIVVSDLDMPSVDGMELIRWMGAHAAGTALIVASAAEAALLASVEEMARAYGVSVLGTVQKPVTRARLETLLALYRARPHAPAVRPPAALSFSAAAILQGLENDDFEPFFQPQVAIASGDIVGVEALARWHHPEHGILSASDFVQTFADPSQVELLMMCMLRKAARFSRAIDSAGHRCTVSVNVSPASLGSIATGDLIRDVVHEEQAKPADLVLEVTESAATADVGRVLENLTRLRMRGFALSIDDYGTGYSSLAQLMRIPFCEVKIDRQFVVAAVRHPPARIVVESTLQMARALGLRTVAEGVESPEHLELVAKLGCDLAQGFHVGLPMPASACLDWMGRQPASPRAS